MPLLFGEPVIVITIEAQYGESYRSVGLSIYTLLLTVRGNEIAVKLGGCLIFLEIEFVGAVIRNAY